MTLDQLEGLEDFDDLFMGIWSAIEYGRDKEQYKRRILAVVNESAYQAAQRVVDLMNEDGVHYEATCTHMQFIVHRAAE